MRIAVHLRSRRSSGASFNTADTMQVAALPSRVRVPSIADLLDAASPGLPPVMVTATSVCGTTSVGAGAGAGAAGVGAEAWGSFGGAGLADFHFVRLMQARQGFSSAREAADLQLPMATETEAQALLHAASRAAADSAAVSSSGLLGWARWLLACLSHSLSHFPDAVMRWQAQAQTSADVAAAPAGSTAAPRPWAHFLPPLLQQQAPAQRDQIDGGGGSWGWPYAEPSIASWIAARQPVSHVLSGAGGRFCFHGVPAGAYHLMLAPGHAEVQSLGLAPAPLALAVSIGSSSSDTDGSDGSEDTLALAPLVGVPLTLQRPTVAGQLTIAASSSSSIAGGSAARTEQEELALLLALSPSGSAADWATAVAPVRVPVAAGCRVAVLPLPAAQSLQALAREGAAAVPIPVTVHGAWHGAFSVHARLVSARTLANASTSASRGYPLPASMPCSDLLPLLPSARTSGAAAAAAAATEPAELEAQLAAAGFASTRGGSAAMHLPVAVHVTGADFGTADAAALFAALSADVDAVKSEAAAASAAAAAAASAKSKAATGGRPEPLQLLAPLTAALSRLTVNSAATLLVLLLTSAALCFPAQAIAAVAWAKQLVGLQQRSVMSEGPHGSRSIPQRRNKVASKATR